MTAKLIFPVLLGLAGCAVLIALGVWQLQRLDWKLGVIAEAEAMMAAEPEPLPVGPEPADWNRRPVSLDGTLAGEELHVLTSGTAAGTGYRAIARVDLADGRAVMADLGLLPVDDKEASATTGPVSITGNLLWPDDVNSSTPAPDLDRNIWFGRDVDAMAEALGTEPVLVTVRALTPPDPRTVPLPLDTAQFKNDHLSYAITWFGLAIVWAGMTAFLIRRTLQKDA